MKNDCDLLVICPDPGSTPEDAAGRGLRRALSSVAETLGLTLTPDIGWEGEPLTGLPRASEHIGPGEAEKHLIDDWTEAPKYIRLAAEESEKDGTPTGIFKHSEHGWGVVWSGGQGPAFARTYEISISFSNAVQFKEIRLANPKLILACGVPAASELLGRKDIKITEDRAKVWWIDGPILPSALALMITYHPAAVARNHKLRDWWVRDLKRTLEHTIK